MGGRNSRFLVQETRFMPTLVLIRHGQSAWNLENRFTGWWDVDVTEQGAEEARAAGRLLREKGLDFDQCYTSVARTSVVWGKSVSVRVDLGVCLLIKKKLLTNIYHNSFT